MDPVRLAIDARERGDYDTALALLVAAERDARLPGETLKPPSFIHLVEWGQLAEIHAPARAALAALRDEHVALLFSGDSHSGDPASDGAPRSRFWDIAWFNDILGDTRSTYEVFARLAETAPEVAQQHAWRALPAIVAEKDFAFGARYLPEPLERLDELNATARFRPLLPPAGHAPLLSALLTNFTRAVMLCTAILEGTGRDGEAAALRAKALAGIDSAELRALAEREFAHRGTIARMVSEHQAALPPLAD
jgi:hypothetical protein